MSAPPVDVQRLRELRSDLSEFASPLRDPEPLRMLIDELLIALISHEEWRVEAELRERP